MPDYIIFGGRLDDFPGALEAVWYQESVAGFEFSGVAVFVGETNMAFGDVAKFVAVLKGVPFAGCAGPGTGGEFTFVWGFEHRGNRMFGIAGENAIFRQFSFCIRERAIGKSNDLDRF